MTRAYDVQERCRNDWWDSSQIFEGYSWRIWAAMTVEFVSKSVEICLLKTRCRSIYGVAVILVCWDGFVVSRFCLELYRNRWVGTTISVWLIVLLVKKTGAEFRSWVQVELAILSLEVRNRSYVFMIWYIVLFVMTMSLVWKSCLCVSRVLQG